MGNGKVPGSFLPGPHCPLQPLKDSMWPPGLTVLSSVCQGPLAATKNGIHVVFKESQGASSPGSTQDKEGTVPIVTPSAQQELGDFSTGMPWGRKTSQSG